jgi:putative endonuclease
MQAVDFKKQQRIRKVAAAYLLQHHYSYYQTPCRFDVISIDDNEIRLFRNAF